MANGPNLDKMSLDELKALAKDIEKAIVKTERDQLKKARTAAEEAAKKHGFSLDEVMNGAGKPKSKKAASAPKYRNPENPEQTWSGKGRQPDWFKAAVGKGKSPDEMAV